MPPESDSTTAWRPGGADRSWRRLVFPSVFLLTLAQTVGGVVEHSSGVATIVGCALVLAFCVVYVSAVASLSTRPVRTFWVSFTVLCAIFVAETFFAHEGALVMLIFIGTLTIAVLWRRAIPIVIGLIAISYVVPAMIPAWHHGLDADAAVTLSIVLAAMFAFFGLVRANVELGAARAEVAALAAEGERQRIARDLHDLLGHSLTTITVKSGLARRLFERGDPERAATEIAEVEALSRRSLADVRAAVAGYRTTTLTGELATGRELLRTLGIEAELPPSADVVDPAHHELFGWVVREGLTNVVRHSHATTCTIAVGRHWITVTDDGIGGAATSGTGLLGLAERVGQAGGRLVAGRCDRGWQLRADMDRSPAVADFRGLDGPARLTGVRSGDDDR